MKSSDRQAILEIFRQYHQEIKHMVVELEADDNEFPVEILNEVRAILNHLAKCFLLEDDKPDNYEEQISVQVHDAKVHLKRAFIDCYKYGCISSEDYYLSFQHQMRNVDLTIIDNGVFSSKLTQSYTNAQEAIKQAKKAELDAMSSATEEEIYSLYQNAYIAYDEVRCLIKEKNKEIENARHRQSTREIRNNIFGIAGIISLILGLIAIIK